MVRAPIRNARRGNDGVPERIFVNEECRVRNYGHVFERLWLFPALARAGMPSRSEAGAARSVSPIGRNIKDLFKDEEYRLVRSASRAFIWWLRGFEQTTPPLRGIPSLLRRGMALLSA
jgi:hypothetical protein